MIGKAIGAIILIIIFLGILYSAGHYQQTSQQNSQQTTQDDNTHDKKHKKSQDNNHQKNHKKSDNGNSEGLSNQGQGSEEQNNQGKSSQSDTETQNAGTVDLQPVRRTEMSSDSEDPCLRVISGALENVGNKDAKNVILQITFLTMYDQIVDRRELPIGDIGPGQQRDYEGKFTVCWKDNIHPSYALKYD